MLEEPYGVLIKLHSIPGLCTCREEAWLSLGGTGGGLARRVF